MILNELYKLNELSPDTLSSYKKAAGADATAADAAGDVKRGNKRFKGIVNATKKQFANDTKGMTEDDDAVAAFLSKGGEIQQLKPQRGPKRSGVSFASKHIGSASGRGNTKGKVSGLGANTGKSGKPVVTAEQGMAEALGDLRPKLGNRRDQGKSVRKWRRARGMDESGVAESREYSSVTNAITRRIITQHPEVLAKYGPDVVGMAIDEIADFVGDVDEIGSSDVSGWTSQVIRSLARFPPLREQGMTEGQVNELSSDLLKRAALVAKDKSDKAMDPKIHNALGGGYMNPLAKHYNTVSDKFSNQAAKVGQRNAAKNIASPAVMRKIGMAEGSNNSKTIITEALIAQKLWENAGRKLMEAQLTADQITQIFQQIQQDATAAGDNRTLIGKGKDAAGAVSAAWTDLKDKIYNSKPMSNFASAYDTAAEKLKQATGGDAGAMKYIQKYRDFATKHPMLQSAIYAALIAASGISGVGIAGAAALGLFKLVDQAIQGKDIRSAMWSGVKTGAQAFAAGQIGQALKGQPDALTTGGETDISGYEKTMTGKFGDFGQPTYNLQPLQDMASDPNLSPIAQDLAAKLAAGKEVTGVGEYLRKAMDVAAQKATMMGDMPDGSANAGMRTFMSLQNLFKAVDDAGLMSTIKESVTLSESQIFLMISKIVERHRKLDEGLMDTIKGAAGKAVGSVVNYAKTKGTNLTTKITADKLLQAWKKAGSPMDSATVAKVIQDAGVPATSVQQVYGTMKIPFDAAPAQPSASSTGGIAQPTATGLQHTASAANPNQPAAAAPAAPAAPGAGAFGQMAGQLKAAAPKTPAPAAGKLPGEDPQGAGYVGRREVARQQAARAAKPAPAKTPNFGGPTGYSGTNYTVKQPAKQPAVAESAGDELQSILKSAGLVRNR